MSQTTLATTYENTTATSMYVKVRVTPGAKKERVLMVDAHEFAIAVKEPAKQNLANKRIIQIIAERFHVPTRAVRMLSGFRSPNKVLTIES